MFYEAATEIDSEEAFSWIAEKGGEWDTTNPDDLRFLQAEAVRLFGNTSHHTRSLSALQAIRAYNSLESEIEEISSPLQEISTGLQKLQELVTSKDHINA